LSSFVRFEIAIDEAGIRSIPEIAGRRTVL
jgi:hypothetical protein